MSSALFEKLTTNYFRKWLNINVSTDVSTGFGIKQNTKIVTRITINRKSGEHWTAVSTSLGHISSDNSIHNIIPLLKKGGVLVV